MSFYSNGATNQCNTANCKQCRNRYKCMDYVAYLERIANSPISPVIQQQESTDIKIDLNPILTLLNDISRQISNNDEKINNITEQLKKLDNKSPQTIDFSVMNSEFESLKNMIAEISSINTTTIIESPQSVEDSGLAIIGDVEDVPKKGDTYFETKRTLFGGTKVVEKKIK